jgi:hypothetical protein
MDMAWIIRKEPQMRKENAGSSQKSSPESIFTIKRGHVCFSVRLRRTEKHSPQLIEKIPLKFIYEEMGMML